MTTTASPPASTRWPRPFRYVYAASLAEGLGFQVGYLAVPVLAVSVLAATPGQVGLLAVLSTVAFLLIGLPAGVWVDRSPRRTVMVAADLSRAVLYASIRWPGGRTRSPSASCTRWCCSPASARSSATWPRRASCRSWSAGTGWWRRTRC